MTAERKRDGEDETGLSAEISIRPKDTEISSLARRASSFLHFFIQYILVGEMRRYRSVTALPRAMGSWRTSFRE